MKWLLAIIVFFLMSPMVWAASYTITSSDSEENTISYWAARLSLTNTQALQQMCSAGVVPYFQQRTKNDGEDAALAFQQLSPTDQATVCTLFAGVGYNCPPGP